MKDIIDEIQDDLDKAKKAHAKGDEAKAIRFLRKAHSEMEAEFSKLPWGVKADIKAKKRNVDINRESVVLPESLLEDLLSAGDEVSGVIREACGGGKYSGKWKELKDALAKHPKRTGDMYSKPKYQKGSLFKENVDDLHTQKSLEDVAKGEYIRIKPNGPVWIKGEYSRKLKKYSITKFDDANKEIFRSGKVKVYVDFTF